MSDSETLTRQQSDYARSFIASLTGNASAVKASDELLLAVFNQLSRREELNVRPDAMGRYSWHAADVSGRVQRPEIDLKVFENIGKTSPASRWPGGRQFAVCLSHDMDHVTSFATPEKIRRAMRRFRAGGRATEVLRDTRTAVRQAASSLVKGLLRRPDKIVDVAKWLSVEEAAGFKSSLYFFAGEVSPWHPYDCDYAFDDRIRFSGSSCTVAEMMRLVGNAGWEVGLHGSICTATNEGAFVHQKRQIEEVMGCCVETTRQHFLQFNAVETPAIHDAAGIICDTTIAFNDDLGFRAGTCFPYRSWNWREGRVSAVFQISTQIQDGALFRHHPTIGSALDACARVIADVRKVGGCLGVLFHPHHLSTERGFIVYRDLLTELKNLGAWGGSCTEVISHWRRANR